MIKNIQTGFLAGEDTKPIDIRKVGIAVSETEILITNIW